MLQKLGAFLLHSVWGWKIEGEIPQDLNKYIVLGGPHTSNWDFALAVFTTWAYDLDCKILAKKELFKPPMSLVFRALNVIPVDRGKNNNLVSAVAEMYNQSDKLVIALSPEGTRRPVKRFKSGFYHIARIANVPIVAIGANYRDKILTFLPPYYVTDDQEADFQYFYEYYDRQIGKVEENDFKIARGDAADEKN